MSTMINLTATFRGIVTDVTPRCPTKGNYHNRLVGRRNRGVVRKGKKEAENGQSKRILTYKSRGSEGWVLKVSHKEEAERGSVRMQMGQFEAVNGDRVSFGSNLEVESVGGMFKDQHTVRAT
jgi:hypothetical protein